MSSQWENEQAKKMHRATDDSVRTARCGYSGSNAMPQPDVLVTEPDVNHGLELKGPLEKDTMSVEASGLEQLVAFANSYTMVYLVVKFSRRRPLVVRHYPNVRGLDGIEADWSDLSVVEQFAALVPDCFNPRVRTSDETGVTRLYLDKPSTDDWSSGYGEDDHETILEELGVMGGLSL